MVLGLLTLRKVRKAGDTETLNSWQHLEQKSKNFFSREGRYDFDIPPNGSFSTYDISFFGMKD